MPANLTPQYLKAEQEFRRAKTNEERIAALENMLALIPKHKGTDHLQADLKARLSKLRRQSGEKKGSARARSLLIERTGAAQVALLGYPNVGKSQILDMLTSAEPHVADYPFTTRQPQPGILQYEDVQIQLMDLPAVTVDFMDTWVPNQLRWADAALLVVDLGSDELLDQVQGVCDRLSHVRIELVSQRVAEEDRSYTTFYLRTRVVANKTDADGASDRLDMLRDLVGDRFGIEPASMLDDSSISHLRQVIWEFTEVIRVYTKPPGKKPDMDKPFTLPAGSTVEDLASEIHREFVDTLKHARIWGADAYDGQYVARDHPLHDGDVVELHI